MVTLGVGGACFSRGGIGYMGTCRTTGVASVLFLLRSTGFSWTGGPSACNQKKITILLLLHLYVIAPSLKKRLNNYCCGFTSRSSCDLFRYIILHYKRPFQGMLSRTFAKRCVFCNTRLLFPRWEQNNPLLHNYTSTTMFACILYAIQPYNAVFYFILSCWFESDTKDDTSRAKNRSNKFS